MIQDTVSKSNLLILESPIFGSVKARHFKREQPLLGELILMVRLYLADPDFYGKSHLSV